jgi:large subunit ribosomal protein L23
VKEFYQVIEAPLLTEKGTMIGEESNQFLFRVPRQANKTEIREAVEKLFNVQVEKVRTLNYLGKTRRVGRSLGRRPAWKKAYVKLAAGQRIDFFAGA